MRSFFQDVRYGLRVMLANPGFAAVAVLTLALGIAVNTTVFTWIDTILLQPLSGTGDGDRLVMFESVQRDGESHNISYPDYRDYRNNLKLISGLAVSLQPNAFSIGEGERAQRVWGELVSGNYFAVLGVKPVLGRFFTAEEQGEKPAAYPVAVISARFWRSGFNSDPGVIGRTVRVNRQQLTIVGVAPADFYGITRGLMFDMWAPLTMGPQLRIVDEAMLQNRRSRPIQAIARLKPGVTIEQARAEVAALAGELARTYPNTNENFSATLLSQSESHAGVQSLLAGPLRILMAMCVVVLLIACVNVANLLLARSMARQRELGIRLALGASPGRLARQLLTEALLLAGAGTLIGVPLAMFLQRSLFYLAPSIIGLPVGLDMRMNAGILGFTVLICAGAALLSGASPALHAIRPDMNEQLKEGGRGGTSGAHSHRMRSAFVVAEVALATVALTGAGLFLSSFRAAKAIHPGFNPRNVLISRFYHSSSGYTAEQRKQFCLRLRDRLETAPGIAAVSYADTIPLGFGLGPGATLEIEGYVPAQSENMTIPRTLVAPGYFRTIRMPLLEGRDFTAQDDENGAPVIIVNQSFARRFFSGGNPLGRRARAWGKWRTIVGLVRDAKYYHLTEPPQPYLFAPAEQVGVAPEIAFYVRTAGDMAETLRTIRREAAGLDPNAGAFDAMALSDYIASPLFPQKTAASLLSVLGAVSLLLAAVGLYSVMAYGVGERTQEFGIRMALGAQERDVLGIVVAKGMILTAAGVLAGIAAALAAARLVASMLVDVSATDPLIFAGAALFLGAVALVASYLPARRATRVDPAVTLRCQ